MIERNSDLPQAVLDILNARGQGAWRMIYNEGIKAGLCQHNARSKAWRAVQKHRGCASCGKGRNFFK